MSAGVPASKADVVEQELEEDVETEEEEEDEDEDEEPDEEEEAVELEEPLTTDELDWEVPELVIALVLLVLLLLALLPKVGDVVLLADAVDPMPVLETDDEEVVELEEPDPTTSR
jgi:hypothetical protein